MRTFAEVARLPLSKLPMAARLPRVLFPHWGLELADDTSWIVHPHGKVSENRVIEKMKKRFDEIVPL